MKLFQAYYLLLVIFLSLIAPSIIAFPYYAKPGCNDTCGNKVRIPFPFGIGANCSVNEWYTVVCNSSTPYLSAPNDHLQILGVNLENQTVTVNVPKISACQNSSMSVDLDTSPFLFSKSHNKFVFEGCGNVVILENGINRLLTGCSTTCSNDTISDKNNCVGVTCCQTPIPYHLKSYSINFTRRLESQQQQHGGDGGCGSAFLVDETSYANRRFSRQSVGEDMSFVPMSLLWTLADPEFQNVKCCLSMSRRKVDLRNGTSIDTWKCSSDYGPYIGNLYLSNGCDDVVTVECARCRDSGGSCSYFEILDVDGLFKEWNFTCFPHFGRTSGLNFTLIILILIGVCIGSGSIFIGIIYGLYKLIKRTITRRRRKRIFKRINRDLLLKQQEEVDPSLVDKTILFTSRTLEKATDHFNENRILGRGGQGTVYKGMLVDGRIVAVKKSKIVNESQLEQFINEVVILSQVNHRNVVKLLGCCLETEVPLLVSEFISNGTLYDLIHNETNEFSFCWNMRLQIATEVAEALAYLHSATSIPIYHRDIKTNNILLDDKYRAKVSDFGTSRFVSMDQTHLTTLVKGTFGYLDPEYFQSSQFTEKSDVYSFGVVLVELLTGERPISLTRFGENRSLATHFILAMEEDRVMSIFDATVIREGTRDELHGVANLAMRCLNPIGKNRPAMKEVAIELETIRTSHTDSIVHTNIIPVMYGEKLSMVACGETTSTFSSDGNISEPCKKADSM